MNEDRDPLDDLLSNTLARSLDPQRGRAAAAFAHQPSTPRGRSRSWVLTIGSAGLLATAAAVAAFAWSLPGRTPAPMAEPTVPEPVQLAEVAAPAEDVEPSTVAAAAEWPPEPYQRITLWRAFDEGTVVLGGDTPFRQFRRFAVEQTTWTDPQDESTVAMTVPREDVVLVEMPVY